MQVNVYWVNLKRYDAHLVLRTLIPGPLKHCFYAFTVTKRASSFANFEYKIMLTLGIMLPIEVLNVPSSLWRKELPYTVAFTD